MHDFRINIKWHFADIKTDGERFTFYAMFAKTERVNLLVNVM